MTNTKIELGPMRLVEGGKGLVVTRIAKSFNKRPVVRSVSLSLKRGEVVGLLGPNGAGKTTCFYMISGLIPADAGTIEVDGHDVTRLPMYRRARLGIGYLPQEASIFRGMTAEENIRATAELEEPLAGIDPIAVGDIRDLVKHLKDRGIGVLITDHNVRDALDMIDRGYILHDGRVLKEGTPSDIVGDREVRRVYLGERFSL